MGQTCSCWSACVKKSRRRRTGHKRFDFAPKRSWKYKDATLLNEFHEMEMNHDKNIHGVEAGQLMDDNGAAASSSFINSHRHQGEGLSSDEEEIDTGSYRPSGRLVFTEADSDDEIVTTPPGKGGYTHLDHGQGDYDDDDETRDRSQSTGSEQIGRFEVWDVDERAETAGSPSLPLQDGTHTDHELSAPHVHEEETSQLMSNA